MPDIKNVADKADVIINGYAFTRNEDRIQVLNLNSPDKAAVFSADGLVLETTMDDIELLCPSCLTYRHEDEKLSHLKRHKGMKKKSEPQSDSEKCCSRFSRT